MSQVRSALVIGTSEYHDSKLSPLRSPAKDVDALAKVLSNPAIGAFDVQSAINQSEAQLRRELGRFFGNRGRTDLLLVYISCHGLKDPGGQLYFAATDTDPGNLAATGISAEFINQLMTTSRSQRVVLVLDCCYSGAFGRGIKAGDGVDIGERFEGRGRVVITSSSALEYSFEGATDDSGTSVFTSALVQGLETGQADLDGDGWITIAELYDYVYMQVREATPNQTPSKWEYDTRGQIYIARNPTLSASLSVEEISGIFPPSTYPIELIERPTADDGNAAAPQAEPGWTDQLEPTSSEPVGQYTAEPIVTNDYWTVGDQLDYEPYAIAISEFIRHEGTIPPLTIGIRAPWGAGKTSLMRMVQDRLDPPRKSGRTEAGSDHRQTVTLTPASRRLIMGWPWWKRWVANPIRQNESFSNVTNKTLLRKLRRPHTSASEPTSTDPASGAEYLKIESANPSWRPSVWFSPWMYESGEQIWAGLAHEVIAQLTERMQPAEREGFWLELNLRRVDADALRRRVHRALLERLVPLVGGLAFIVLVAVALFFFHLILPSAASSLNLVAKGLLATGSAGAALAGIFRIIAFRRQPIAGSLTMLIREPDYARDWQQLISEQGKGAYSELVRDPDYESRLGYLYLVQTDIRRVLDLIATRDRPVVIFVDDLDRCSPSTVTQVVEAINLFLAGQFPNCIFIVAMDPEMVAAHIDVAYKSLIATLTNDDYWGDARALGWRFLDKIVQLPISLPTLRSDQASQFLGTALVDAPKTAKYSNTQVELDASRLRQIEDAIQQQHPSISDISEAAATAEEELSGLPDVPGSLSAEAQEAIRRELKRRLHPDDPEVQAIVAAVTGRLAKNPREIKRFVNVFRFYAVLRQEREAAGFPAPDTLAEIAKLAVIAVRWPHLRAALGHQIGGTERDTVLALLEDRAAELPENVDRAERKATFNTALTNAQIPEKLRARLLASDDLCDLLACSPSIGTAAAGYL